MSNNKNHPGKEDITVNNEKQQPSDTYRKLPDKPDNAPESISTADDIANGKYSKTGTRKEDKDFDTIRSGN